MKPFIGAMIATLGVVASNGTDEHPAVVTRVWSDKDPAIDKDHSILVNCTVFPDCGTLPARPQGSIRLFETREEAVAEQEKQNAIGENREFYRKRGMSGPMVAYWPNKGY